jgi:hypothetical protein
VQLRVREEVVLGGRGAEVLGVPGALFEALALSTGASDAAVF